MLSLKTIRKAFGRILAVDDLSLEVRRGEVFGLLGPNGAGKTTTVNLVVGLLSPDGGLITLDGLGSPTDPAARSKLGVAPQALAIYEDLTGAENVEFFARLFGLAGRARRDRVAWALDFVGLTDRRNDRAKTYSGGMKRRLNLATAIVHDPQLLLLDEPTVGVDPQSRNAIFGNIETLRRNGTTVVYTTHYMEEAQRLCDRVGIIDRGKLRALDTVERLIGTYGGRSAIRATLDGEEKRIETDDPVADLNRLQAGGRLTSFHLDRPDLETVFLNLTGRSLRD